MLSTPDDESFEWGPRARYLSQHFVEHLCSPEGMPALVKEIERVIFDAQPINQTDGTSNFNELLELRASPHRMKRQKAIAAISDISEAIARENEKKEQTSIIADQVFEKQKAIQRLEDDRKSIVLSASAPLMDRVNLLRSAIETVNGNISQLRRRESALLQLKFEIEDQTKVKSPSELRVLQLKFASSSLNDSDWNKFLLRYTGNVVDLVDHSISDIGKTAGELSGTEPTQLNAKGRYCEETADLKTLPLAVLEAELRRLEGGITASKVASDRYSAVSKKILNEKAALATLQEKLEDCKKAPERLKELWASREVAFKSSIEALLDEEKVLTELYTPIQKRISGGSGTLSKLKFTVSRRANISKWQANGEVLLDERSKIMRDIGSLADLAEKTLRTPWETGNVTDIIAAYEDFRTDYELKLFEVLLPKPDKEDARKASKQFAEWLFGTDHLSIEYGITYDGINIADLSPGTRGVVLVVVYLALDDLDTRPLIIDQPEENLDPQSIFEELVPLFREAKRNRQVIMVTHNANLVVNADADQVIVASVGPYSGGGLPPISYSGGGLDEPATRDAVCRILEGGVEAFKERGKRLRISLLQ